MSAPLNTRRALISVYDKAGIVAFARALHEEFGIELISTGGTAKTLQDAGLPVTLVEQITGFPEMLDGRVKTLHPKIHAAILADRDDPEHLRQLAEQGIEPIDMVVVDLYPFAETVARPGCTFEEALEMIDIGGPCLLRAAAKNHRHVLAVPGPDFAKAALAELREHGSFRADTRRIFAQVVFRFTAQYDAPIHAFLAKDDPVLPSALAVWLHGHGETRYGENPTQRGGLYFDPAGRFSAANLVVAHRRSGEAGRGGPLLEGGSEMSYNNYADASTALELCAELTRAQRLEEPQASARGSSVGTFACCFIKHTNPCGVAMGAEPIEVYRRAYLGDPNAALGGILAVNFSVDAAFAEAVMDTYQRWGKPLKEARVPYAPGGFFVEVWLAPSFDKAAIEVIRTKKEWGQRVRLLEVGDMGVPPDPNELDFKRIAGGMLVQTRDLLGLNEEQWQVVSRRRPTETEMSDLRLAWLICKHAKSNALTICRDGMLIGNGAGQMSRVMSCRIATWLAQQNGHADQLKGAVAASDAFFPFRDGPDLLIDAGVTALIQPGGSKRDPEVIVACDARGVALIFTATRHFKH